MNRARCALPIALKSLCDTGCIYREPAFSHLACRTAPKTSACIAPCHSTMKCACCKRKSIMEFKCSCEKVFCVKCRLPEVHACSKPAITPVALPPAVIAPKIEKI